MTRGIEAAAAGMAGIMNQNDIIANNLANINTPGFKQTLVSFQNIKDNDITGIDPSDNNGKTLGKLSSGSTIASTVFDFKQGSIKQTGNQMDLAINGDGFFVVRTPDGDAYTRNGTFIRKDDGTVITSDGYEVMGNSGPLNLNVNDPKGKEVKILGDGSIQVGKEMVDKIKIVDFNDKRQLQAMGNSLYVPVNNEKPVEAKGFEIAQGSLEMSNSNAIESMVNSINGMRTYETMAKVMETNHKELGKTASELGRIKR